MKNEHAIKKPDYSKLKRKLYLYILITIIAAIGFVLFLRLFIQQQASVGDWIVDFLEHRFRLNHEVALRVYYSTIRSNIGTFTYIAIGISFLVLCRVLLSKFVKYFDEINTGIDMLIRN